MSVRRYEYGEREPKWKPLAKLAKLYGMSPGELLDRLIGWNTPESENTMKKYIHAKEFEGDDLGQKKADSKLVGKYEEWEINNLLAKFNIDRKQAVDAIKLNGPSMEKVKKYLQDKYGLR